MRSCDPYRVVLVTAPDQETARKLARVVLEARLAACANLLPGVESHFWWQGKIDTGSEVLILFKTTRTSFGKLEKLIVANHPYETPEVITLPILEGNTAYLQWIDESMVTESSE
jgi:periplasmic divalent cation tolerance protein